MEFDGDGEERCGVGGRLWSVELGGAAGMGCAWWVGVEAIGDLVELRLGPDNERIWERGEFVSPKSGS